MALFRVVVRKAINQTGALYKWSNVWYTDAPDVTTAANRGIGYWNRARHFHSTEAFAYEVYASDLVPNTQNFTIIPVTAGIHHGTYTMTGERYHSAICVRVDLTVTNSRASRKFFRLPLGEGEVVNGQTIVTGLETVIDTRMAEILALGAQSPLDESGNPFTGFVIRGLTTRRLGRDAAFAVPPDPGA